MMCLALDLSFTGTGIAVMTSSKVHELNLVSTAPGDGDDVERADFIAEEVAATYKRWQPEMVVIEDYAHSRPTNQSRLGELGGIVKRELWKAGKEPGTWHEVVSSSVKLFITGNGHADKKAMIAAATGFLQAYDCQDTRTLKLVRNDNCADAICIGRYGLAHYVA